MHRKNSLPRKITSTAIPLNRRQATSLLLGSLTLPTLVTSLAEASTGWSLPGWKEDTLTKDCHAYINSAVAAVKQKKSIFAISGAEWLNCGVMHSKWGDEYSRLGNLHLLDLLIQSHQTYLKSKFGSEAVNRYLYNGVHKVWTETAGSFTAVGDALNAPTTAVRMLTSAACGGLEASTISVDILSLGFALTGVFEPLAVLFGGVGIVFGFAHLALC